MSMYPTRVYDILMYGGALLILLLIITVISVIMLLYRWHRMITVGTRTIQSVGNSILVPLLSLFSLFRESKSTTKSKKTV